MGKKPAIGSPAPDFTLHDQNGTNVTLSGLKGQKVVLYFYPKDNTPGCTIQACNLRDNYSALKKAGYRIFGISPDSSRKHANFIKKFNLPFDLLADTEKEVAEKYGVWAKKKLFGRSYMGVLRTTFIVDELGMISEVIESVKTAGHAGQILK